MSKTKSKKKQAQAQTPSKAQMKAKTEVLELALKLSKTGPDGTVLEGLVLAHILEEQRLLREELAAFRRTERRSTVQSLDDRIKAVHRRIDKVEKEAAQQHVPREIPVRQNADDADETWSDGDETSEGMKRTIGYLNCQLFNLKVDVVRLGQAVADVTVTIAPQNAPEASAQERADTAPKVVDPMLPATPPANVNSEEPSVASAGPSPAIEAEASSLPQTRPSSPIKVPQVTSPPGFEGWLKRALDTIRADFAARANKLDETMLAFAARVARTAGNNDSALPEIWQHDEASHEEPTDSDLDWEDATTDNNSWSPPLWEGGGPEGLGRSPSPENLDPRDQLLDSINDW